MNTRRRKRILKILSFTVAAALIGVILYATNAFTGNPLSSQTAKKAIQRHVEHNYPDLALHVGETHYNPKFAEYWAEASSKTSPDTRFRVYYGNGKIKYDEYDSHVVGRMNTLQRLEQEYSAKVKPILAEIEGLSDPGANVMLDDPKDEAREKLTLDMEFEPNLPLNVRLSIHADMQDPSLSSMADALERIHQRLLEEGCTFAEYSIDVEGGGKLVSASFVKPGDIESGELAARLEAAWAASQGDSGPYLDKEEDPQAETENEIYVFMKGGEQ